MEVKLISSTQNLLDVVYTGATTCYNEGSPIDMWFDVCNIPQEKKIKLINTCIQSGHESVLEHSQFTFGISGVSRSCSHQLVRTRIGVGISQQSQRYVQIKENKEELEQLFNTPVEDYSKPNGLYDVLDKYFVNGRELKNVNGYYNALNEYLEAINLGEKAEDARRFLPNATKTNMVFTLNLRSFIHLCNERCCTRAQAEIRHLVHLMVQEALKDNEWLKPYLVAKCEKYGVCYEYKSCGKTPTMKDLEEIWRANVYVNY